ncbi:MAG: hypothetical protein M3T49_04865 [Candidatus Eremiobacteraeota bacterium]|nr:hypothetical protein [Candidatus Eremiobacteraeota bacterium]
MQSVSQAIADGWKPHFPLERTAHDPNVILMSHKRADGLHELGFAQMDAAFRTSWT